MKLDRFNKPPGALNGDLHLDCHTGYIRLAVLAYYPISGYCPSNRFGESYLYGGKRTDGIE